MVETLRQRLARNEVAIVCGVGRTLHHNFLQMLGMHGGFHGVWFDMEHVGNSIEQLEIGTLAVRSQGMDCFVRIPPTDYSMVSRSLESGASGVMIAQVRSAQQTEEIVQWAKYAPRGWRGLNTASYDARFGLVSAKDHCAKANQETLVIIQIETREAVEQCEQIAAVPGVDLLFIGPSDLSQALGVTGDFWNPKCLEAVDHVAESCRRQGKPWGVLPPDPKYAARCIERGCKMLSIASDCRILNAGIQHYKDLYREFL